MTSPLLTSNHDYPFYILGVIGDEGGHGILGRFRQEVGLLLLP